MKDIRSALVTAMHSHADMANEDTGPGRPAKGEQLQPNAAHSGRDVQRPGRRSGEWGQASPRSNTAITARAEGASGSGTGQTKSEPVNREAPRNWDPADKEAFGALPESTQDFVLRQCRTIETELGKKSQRLAAFHREYEPVAKIIEPFAGRLKEINLTPGAAIQRYIDIERRLAAGDGVAVIKALVDGYKVAPDQVIQALGVKLPDTRLRSLFYPAQRDQQLPKNVTRQVNQPKDWETAERWGSPGSANRAGALRDFELKIEQFKTAQDTAGNPLHPHYADVEPEMAAMALAYSSRGQTIPSLKELYEKAVWSNPGLRSALVSSQTGSSKTVADAGSKPRTAARTPTWSSSAAESKQMLTKQSAVRSLRDEILAHVSGA